MRQSNAKQYGGAAPLANSAGSREAIAPGTPIRSGLSIQNTGSNNLRLMFGRPTTNAADDFIINPGTTVNFRDPVPVEAIFLSCRTTTTFCIVEETIADEQTRGRVAAFLGKILGR